MALSISLAFYDMFLALEFFLVGKYGSSVKCMDEEKIYVSLICNNGSVKTELCVCKSDI